MTRTELDENDKKRELQMLAELTKFHQNNAVRVAGLNNPNAIVDTVLASSITKRRMRIPQVDVDVHPFCLDRQIADEFERLNYNKNPRFYDPTVTETPRLKEPNLHNHCSFIAKADEIEVSSPRIRPEFDAVVAPASYQPGIDAIPKLGTIDASSLNLMEETQTSRLAVSNYGKAIMDPKPKSFGHRPQSASRMFHPVSHSVQRDCPSQLSPFTKHKPTGVRTGMSVMKLESLLHPERNSPLKTRKNAKKVTFKPSTLVISSSNSTNGNSSALVQLEKQYNNSLYLPKPIERTRTVHNPPPLDLTTAELMEKYRKLSIGIQRDVF